jgi:hypothetical protein
MDDEGAAQPRPDDAKAEITPKSAGDARRERLAAQLKANLKRRKQQARSRGDAGGAQD